MPDTDFPESQERVELNQTRLISIALSVGALILALSVLLWALASYAQLSRAETVSLLDFFRTTALLVAGLAGGLLLWGLAHGLRRLEALVERPVEDPAAHSGDTMRGGPAVRHEPHPAGADAAAWPELLGTVRELRDVMLLSNEDRAQRVRLQGRALAQRLSDEIPALLQAHRWVEAQRQVQQARERFPGLPEWDTLEQQIEKLRTSVESRDVANTSRQVADLIGLGAFERARTMIADLLQRHPNSQQARDLYRRLNVQHEKAEAEQRTRLMNQAQEAVSRREWNTALGLANDVIRRFPLSPEAEALRQQLPTLVENAEIHTRQQMEQHFRDLMNDHLYGEALDVAHEFIDRYPNSPQAAALRPQLPRLERLAAVRA